MNKKLVLLLPIIAGISWGSGGVFIRLLNNYGLDSLTIFASRVVLATIILFVGLLIFNREALKVNIKDIWIFIGSGIFGALLLNLCYNEAAFTLTLSLTVVLLSLAPIFAIIFSAILFDEKITKLKVLCIILAIIGCILVSGVLENGTGFGLSPKGIIFGLFSAVFWALYGIFSKIATQKGYSTFTTIFYSFLIISIAVLLPSNWSMFGNFIINSPLNNGIFALLHSLFTSVIPYLLFTLSLKYMENGKASILCSGAEPLSASIFGLIFFSEYLSALNVVGILITIFAISLLSKNDAQ